MTNSTGERRPRPAGGHSPKVKAIREFAQRARSADISMEDLADKDAEQYWKGRDDAMADKIRENRLRRMAERQGLRLVKSRRRDPRALGYGTYMLVDVQTNGIVASGLSDGYGLDLDQIEQELTK